jgi:hypothetical protein
LLAAKDGLEVTGGEADAEALPFEHLGHGRFTRTLNPGVTVYRWRAS